MFLYNLFAKKNPIQQDQKAVVLLNVDQKVNVIKKIHPELDEKINKLLELKTKEQEGLDKKSLIERLFNDSKNMRPPSIFLTSYPLPDTCKDIDSFENFLESKFPGEALNDLLSYYESFERLYSDSCRFGKSNALYFNNEAVPSQCYPSSQDTLSKTTDRKKKFYDFISKQLGDKKDHFIKNHKQHVFSMLTNLLVLASDEKLIPVSNHGAINFVPEDTGVAIHATAQPKYRRREDMVNDIEDVITFPGPLTTTMMLSDTGTLKFTSITASSTAGAGIILDRNVQFDKLIHICDNIIKASHRSTVVSACEYIKEQLLLGEKNCDPSIAEKYAPILEDFRDGHYRSNYHAFQKTYEGLDERINSVLQKLKQFIRPYSGVPEAKNDPRYQTFVKSYNLCETLKRKLHSLKNSFPKSFRKHNEILKEIDIELPSLQALNETPEGKALAKTAAEPERARRRSSNR